MFLVVLGTLAQRDQGLYLAQQKYFSNWFIWFMFFPIPSGRLIMLIMIANLSCYFLEIQFSDDMLEKVKLNSKIFSQVMTLIVKGEKETATPGKEIIEVSWRIINKPIAILDINF